MLSLLFFLHRQTFRGIVCFREGCTMNSLLYAALGTGFTFFNDRFGAGVVFCFRRPPSGG